MVRPLKVATPELKVPLVPPAVMAPPAPEVIDALAVPVVTPVSMLPPESSTFTTGCWTSATALVAEVEGGVVMASWLAAPSETVIVADTAVMSAPSEKVRV